MRDFTFKIAVGTLSIIAFNLALLAQPSNDDCTSPIDLDPYIGDATCTTFTGTTATSDGIGDTIMGIGDPCIRPGGNDDTVKGIWFDFTAPAGGRIKITYTPGPNYYGLIFPSCGSKIEEGCSFAGTVVATSLTSGATYKVLLGNALDAISPADMCVLIEDPCPAVVTGRTCAEAIVIDPLTLPFDVDDETTCSHDSDYDEADLCTSSYMNGQDKVYEFTPTVDICTKIDLTGTDAGAGVFIFDSCPDGAGVCLESDVGTNPTIDYIQLTSGTTYYIVVSSDSGINQSIEFDIKVSETLCPCGGGPYQLGGDCCASAFDMGLYGGSSTGSWCTNTLPGFTDCSNASLDLAFCGSIENNQFYKFTADSTYVNFDFSMPSNGGPGACDEGIQAQILDTDCSSFTDLGCIFFTGIGTFSMDVTGLTVGTEYYLMVDGFAGDNCDGLQINKPTTILPIKLIDFTGILQNKQVKLTWATGSEVGNDHFLVEHSSDYNTFTHLGKVKGAGTSTQINNYEFIDENPIKGINYYRLKQIDRDGVFSYSNIVSIQFQGNLSLLDIYPNPISENLNFKLSSSMNGEVEVLIYDMLGKEVLRKDITVTIGQNEAQLSSQVLTHGVYFIKVHHNIMGDTYKRFYKN